MNAVFGLLSVRMPGGLRSSFHLFPFISGYFRLFPHISVYFQTNFGANPLVKKLLSKNTLQNDPFSKKPPIRFLGMDHEQPPMTQFNNVDKHPFEPRVETPRKSAIIEKNRLSFFTQTDHSKTSVLKHFSLSESQRKPVRLREFTFQHRPISP